MKKNYKLPPYRLISSAVDGNEQSIEKILAFYDPYISNAVCVIFMMNTATSISLSIWS